MTKEKESIIFTYEIQLGATQRGQVPINPPKNKTLFIDYFIFDNTGGNFEIQNAGIKHMFENVFCLYASSLNERLILNPKGIVKQGGAVLRVQNIGIATDTLNFTIVGFIE